MDASKKAALVKELRERTGSGFLDVKKALEATNYDLEAAVEHLKESGKAKAAKKSGRIAADGLVSVVKSETKVVLFELNSETDFVASNDQFRELAKQIEAALLKNEFSSYDQALQVKLQNGLTIAQAVEEATVKIGEKISFRRVNVYNLKSDQVAGVYTHTNRRFAAYVVAEGTNAEPLRNVAMHVGAMNPEFLDESKVPADKLATYKKQALENAEQSNGFDKKPDKIKESIVNGQLQKILAEILLTSQALVMDPALTVGQYLKQHNLKALDMMRYEVGEGIQKEEVDFAAEVAAQMKK